MSTDDLATETLSSLQNRNLGEPRSTDGLTILKTKAEVEARFQPLEAFITTISTSRANVTVRYTETYSRSRRHQS